MIGKPDPKCRWCKGTGQVVLLTSSCDCDCVKMKFTEILAQNMESFEKSFGIPESLMAQSSGSCGNHSILIPQIVRG